MCFRCDGCGTIGQYPTRVALKLRSKTYPKRTYVLRGQTLEDNGGQGFETAESAEYCAPCAQEMPRV